jgi:hypothetical protein
MSLNCVDAVIQIAQLNQLPIPLIASRRQIDSEALGGGYVNNWTTDAFAEYVRSRDSEYVHLCRDHGGPWQGNSEELLSESVAMSRAKESLLEDITSGFDVLHLDPSVNGSSLTDPKTVEKLFELYAFVIESAKSLGREIEIEIGTEQQSGFYTDPTELASLLQEVTGFCNRRKYSYPLFCVVQTGTLVKEMRNIGMTEGRRNEEYDQKYAVESMERAVRFLAGVTRIHDIYLKEHNSDYLSDGSIASRRSLGIGGINVAPELGVTETRTLVRLATELGLHREVENMLELFYTSGKWKKWLKKESSSSDFDKCIIAGHYSFATSAFKEIYSRIEAAAEKRSINLQQIIVLNLQSAIQRITWNLGYFNQIYNSRDSSYTFSVADGGTAQREASDKRTVLS